MKFNRFYTNAVALVGVASLGLLTQLPVRAQMGTSSPSSTQNQNVDIDSPSDLPNVDSQSERIDRGTNNNSSPNRSNNNTSPNRTNSNSSDRMNQGDMNRTPSIRLPQQPIDSQPGLPNEMSPENGSDSSNQ